MSQGQKIPHCTQEQHHTHCEPQGLEAAQVSKALEETSPSSSHPLMPGNLEEALAAGAPSTSQSPQGASSSDTVTGAISSSKSDECSSRQEKEASSASSKPLSDTENLPVDPLDEKMILLVQFLLQKYQMREPVTKADMIGDVIKECKNDFLEILRRTSEHMELVFGVDIKEVDPSSHSYALVNVLDLTYDARPSGYEGMPRTSILVTILGVIFMKGNRATEEEIWEVLNMMGLYSGRKHFIFGEPRKFITKDLVRERYLDYQRVPNSDPPCYEFLWGPRAHAEVSKMKLLEFLTKIHESDPTCFPSHYEEALRNEAERARARVTTRAGTAAEARAHSSARPSSSSHP
ncbi:Melanoma-associated antigen B16 [Camelus dromedarius]|uniref:Melanoma-associated antigen B16 n=1 Tax=Camelus dromedarius TaxID=9838 RepID=A0A5N4C3H4_CAMDR|nr:melanoma-associated antigen B16-like [Camelus dromedarius]KAB1253398.1 Melanoma-associated antigen B16 [Camelus dromedarius]